MRFGSRAAVIDARRSPARASLSRAGGLQDQVCNLAMVGDQGDVTGLQLDRLGVHALGHKPLEVRVDGAVFGRDGIEAWLGPPRRDRGLARKQRLVERPLDRIVLPIGGVDQDRGQVQSLPTFSCPRRVASSAMRGRRFCPREGSRSARSSELLSRRRFARALRLPVAAYRIQD